ncbi:MAG: EamA family transporter, partial [Methanobacteriota archaeon]
LATILLKEKLTRSFLLWASLAIIGAYVMTFGFDVPSINSGDKTAQAVFYALIASFSFGSSTVLSKRALKNVSFELGTYLRFVISAILLFFLVLGSGDFSSLSHITNKQILIFLIIAFTTGGPAIFLYYYGLKHISASVATICELAFPLTAVILEYLVHDNLLHSAQWVGVVLLLGSMIQVSRLHSPAPSSSSDTGIETAPERDV